MNGKAKSFAQVYDHFLSRAENLRLTDNTRLLYKQTVERFCFWADAEGIEPCDLTSLDVLGYTGRLQREDGKPYAINTLRAHAKGLRCMFAFALEYDLIPNAIKVEMPKPGRREITYLSRGEQARLLEYIEGLSESKPREALIVSLLLDTGLRASALLALNWDQVSWIEEDQSGSIYVTETKGNKPRTVHFGARTWRYMQALIVELKGVEVEGGQTFTANRNRRGWLIDLYLEGNGPIFWAWHPRPARLKTKGLEVILKGMDHVLSRHLHPHLFRHSAIRNWVISGMPLQAIMQLSGHASLKLIQHYSTLERGDVEDLWREYANGD